MGVFLLLHSSLNLTIRINLPGQRVVRFGDMEEVLMKGQLNFCRGLAGMDPLEATGLFRRPVVWG